MIQISKIDDTLSIYRKHRIVIWGTGTSGMKIFHDLMHFGIEPYAFCDNNLKRWGELFFGKKVLSPTELKQENEKKDDILVQIAVVDKYDKEVYQQVLSLGIRRVIYKGEGKIRLEALLKKELIESNSAYWEKSKEEMSAWAHYDEYMMYHHMICNASDELCLICMPQKVGDYTVQKLIEQARIPVFNLWHRPVIYHHDVMESTGKKIRIITAVREPISQNLSSLFEKIKMGGDNIFTTREEYWEDGGNLQNLFDLWMNMEGYIEDTTIRKNDDREQACLTCAGAFGRLIQKFIPEFQENILNILDYPFDKDKGYSVIRSEQCEVFVYQLERLNDIYPEILKWLGAKGEYRLESHNISDDFWYADVYKKAKEEIRIKRSYFNKCFQEPYVKHFYSQTDIEKMRKKWEPHIID